MGAEPRRALDTDAGGGAGRRAVAGACPGRGGVRSRSGGGPVAGANGFDHRGWSADRIGHHVVRNNEIAWCEQAGIVGSMGAAFSEITGNHIHHIYTQRRFRGAEQAGIKFHAPIDMLIERNRIHDAFLEAAIEREWVTREQADECLRIQETVKEVGIDQKIEEILREQFDGDRAALLSALGLGHAVFLCREQVGDGPAMAILGDTIVRADLASILRSPDDVIAVCPVEDPRRFGVVEMAGERVRRFVEKPEVPPSNLAIAGRYIFTPEIFDCLDETGAGYGGEIQLTDAMKLLLKDQNMFGLHFKGKRFDVGNKLDFIKTNLMFGLHHPDFGEELQSWIKELAGEW